MLDFILNLLYPKRCLSCGSFGRYLCSNCNSLLKINKTIICPVCERPAIDGQIHPCCQSKYALDGFVSFWEYEGIIKKVVHKLKYQPWTFSAIPEIIAAALEHELPPAFKQFLKTEPALIPVPLHPSRLKWRGYNHSALIAKELAKHWNLKVVGDMLTRSRNTKPQVGLKFKDRRQNIQNAFQVKDNAQYVMRNTQFVVVDDVWTTGSTLKVCAAVLKKAGAREVWGLTLAC